MEMESGKVKHHQVDPSVHAGRMEMGIEGQAKQIGSLVMVQIEMEMTNNFKTTADPLAMTVIRVSMKSLMGTTDLTMALLHLSDKMLPLLRSEDLLLYPRQTSEIMVYNSAF